MAKKHIFALLLLVFFNSYCGSNGSKSEQLVNEEKKESLKKFDIHYLKLLPIPVRNRIAYFAYCNELKDRAEKKNEYAVYFIGCEHHIVHKNSITGIINSDFTYSDFTYKEASHSYPHLLNWNGSFHENEYPKITCMALVGWENSGGVKIIKAEFLTIKSQLLQLVIDYYEDEKLKKIYTKQDKIDHSENIINPEDLLQDFGFKMEQLQAVTISRDKNSLFLLADKKEELDEHQPLYILQRTKVVDQQSKEKQYNWQFEKTLKCPSPDDDEKYQDMMYFEEFNHIALLHNNKTITEVPLSNDSVDINNQDLLGKFLHKKCVAKNPFTSSLQ